jgi:hypothetical protein
MQRAWKAEREALATVRPLNASLYDKGYVWFWPKIADAITASCGGAVNLDLRIKPRDPAASIRVALRDIRCPRCNGHGRQRIVALARRASIKSGG